MKYLVLLLALCHFLPTSFGQQKKAIEHADVQQWKKIEQSRISNDGKWVAWVQNPVGEGDATLYLWQAESEQQFVFPRATEPRFTADNLFLLFRIKPALDSLKALRRKKVKEEDLPKDTLVVYTLASGQLEKIPNLKNFQTPEKWAGWIFFQVEMPKPVPTPKDTSKTAKPTPKTAKKPKKEDKDTGYRLMVRHTGSGAQDTFAYVKDFVAAKRKPHLLFYSTGKGDTLPFTAHAGAFQNGVYRLDLERNALKALWRGKGKCQQLTLDETGAQAAFLLDNDTTKARIRPWQLWYHGTAQDSARLLAGPSSAWLDQAGEEPDWTLSEYARPVFAEDGTKLYFGIAPQPVLNDTTLLPEEIVQVEVWASTENRIYTQQEVLLESEKKRSYPVVWHVQQNKFVPLGSKAVPELRFQEQRNIDWTLGWTEEPYATAISWEGAAHKDLFYVNQLNGEKILIANNLRCNPRISPAGKYVYWWNERDTAWFTWQVANRQINRLTDNRTVAFYDEETDVPDFPEAYGMAGWLDNDEAILVYDRYDVWQIDPSGKKKARRLTNGRPYQLTHRYIRLDPEQRSIPPKDKMMLHQFLESNKYEGYAWLDLQRDTVMPWFRANMVFSKMPQKARDADALLYTSENYQTFPDLRYLGDLKTVNTLTATRIDKQVSRANPQQADFNWGSIELVSWTSLNGEPLQGLLVKPENFDPKKQYPMIVNFYERLSDGLHQHRTPDFQRSQINYTVYASKGYLVFAPDIPYRIGYPGESAYNAIVSGVTALMNQGFVDPKRIALQGHSWGGYQSAYLITKTNLFACAESGAPVVNMTSAYGGIRWESGLSRAFQYEHTQSRIGGSLWEYPMRFIENSPLFSLDKVQTPVLILHNDKDGAVPWYQGIEMYSALRRLGKPVWMLNYNDEPHWPVKLQNRMDFQKRMMQFFDHYLMDAPMPRWMKNGVPPMEKGIRQGLELEPR